jgi:hypothetical protein
MFDVDESANESDSSEKDPTTSNKPNEDEVKHDLFKFPHDDKIPFSRMLSNMTIWQVQRSNNGDANPNMPLLDDDVQVFDTPPQVVRAPMTPSRDMFMQSMSSMEVDP